MKPVSAALLAFVVLTGAGSALAVAAGLKIELPPDTATLKPGAGADLANQQCMICHSVDYITTQPRDKPLAFWKAEVEKMKKVYGAPIQDDQIDPIAQYLAETYGTGK
jgi:sulfite dehydrogenase (cytochrome) subunit B